MRFIGCKTNLLSEIDAFIHENIDFKQNLFCDIFSGTASVARYFKNQYQIISNDALFFSYVLQKAYVECNRQPHFRKVNALVGDVFSYLTTADVSKETSLFVTENYSPYGEAGRMYFTEKNARRIDFARNSIERWKNEGYLTKNEYFYLLASLIEAIPFVSNITGTYGAFLKHWDKRAYNDLELRKLDIESNKLRNKAYNEDVFDLINHVSGDILYIDPPYNERQYAPNYHVLETIARYDSPVLSGVTGMRPYEALKSSFCVKKEVAEAFSTLLEKADFSHIVLSYNSRGLMSEEFIEKTMKSCGVSTSFAMREIPYRKYKSKIYDDTSVSEYLFYIRKKRQEKIYILGSEREERSGKKVAETSPKYSTYLKSPLNYIGGKFKLLPQIIPLFPNDIDTFVDLFCGGCNVGVNVACNNVVFNDLNTILTDMFSVFRKTSVSKLLATINGLITEWNLSDQNEDAFIAFRNHYNQSHDPIELYVLSCYSFNYQLRFNNNREYNNPFGRNRSRFSETMKNNLLRFVKQLQSMKAKFAAYDFVNYPTDTITTKDFVYCDPPYLITTGSYNDGNRGFKNWTEESERRLYEWLDALHERHIRFALSNVMQHKGKTNEILKEWAGKYKVIHLDKDYSNSSYNTKRLKSDEVLVINY